MRRLALVFALVPLACATRSNDTEDSAKAEPTPEAPVAPDPPAEDGAKAQAPPDDDDCISAGGLPPGSIPDSIGKWAELDLAKLEAALPRDPRDPDLAHTETTAMKRGEAGHPSPLVMRGIRPPGAESSVVSITDFQHECKCDEGMGKRRHEAAKASGHTSETIDGRLVAVKSEETVTDFRVWLADRCELLIRSPSRENAEALFHATDWTALDELCASREPPAQ